MRAENAGSPNQPRASDASVMPSWQADRYLFTFRAISIAALAPGLPSSTASSSCDLRTRTSANSAMTKNAFIAKKNTTRTRLMPIDMSGNSPFQKGRLADGPTFADMRFLLLQFVTITKMRASYAMRGRDFAQLLQKQQHPTRNAQQQRNGAKKNENAGKRRNSPRATHANAQFPRRQMSKRRSRHRASQPPHVS